MSGGEPSSIKRDEMCREGSGSERMLAESISWGLFFMFFREDTSMYQALYRKWRPKTFADVVGQEHITQTLRRQAAQGRLSHAYLFTGTRGTGKTTCAKILAKAVNCQNPSDGDPCGQCPACLGIDNGSLLDVMELDAASNNGVDHVRALRDEAIYSPASVKYRVYIIDEVHMLSVAAFNALLKILEEPPAHLIFILATTELHKVPATILSRCQRFAFKRIRPQDISARLLYVAQREGLELPGVVRTPAGADGAVSHHLEQYAGSARAVVCRQPFPDPFRPGSAGRTVDGGGAIPGWDGGNMADGRGILPAGNPAGRGIVSSNHRAGGIFYQSQLPLHPGFFETAASGSVAGEVPGCGPLLPIHHFEVASGGIPVDLVHLRDFISWLFMDAAGLRPSSGGVYSPGRRAPGAWDGDSAVSLGIGVFSYGRHGPGVSFTSSLRRGADRPHAVGTAASGGAGGPASDYRAVGNVFGVPVYGRGRDDPAASGFASPQAVPGRRSDPLVEIKPFPRVKRPGSS